MKNTAPRSPVARTTSSKAPLVAALGLAIVSSALHAQPSFSYTNWTDLITNWTQTSAPIYWWDSVASSSDGRKLVAGAGYLDPSGNTGEIYTSTNFGQTWAQTSAPNQPWLCASSADGTKLAAAAYGGGIYISTNSGMTWAATGAPSANWEAITSSADGTRLVAGSIWEYNPAQSGGWIYASADSGLNWTQTGAPSEDWATIAASADGTRLVAGFTCCPSGIYASTNSGLDWTSISAPNATWISIASSADGTKLAAVAYQGPGIYVSTNSGVTWSLTSAPGTNWSSVSCSADGTILAAAWTVPLYLTNGSWVFGGGMSVSTNSGLDWVPSTAPYGDWQNIAMSADGTRLAAGVYGGGIWTAQATIQTNLPSLQITQSANAVTVYWQAGQPWTLQQSTNIFPPAVWYPAAGVTNSGGTNYLTLLSPSGSSLFRLAFQP